MLIKSFKTELKKSRFNIYAIDTHTEGEPTRIIYSGFPIIEGKTMMEKKQYVINHHESLRKLLMHEPRGHANMFGAIIMEPCADKADIGILFMDGSGYLNMCGHGSIGVITAAIETGLIKVKSPYMKVTLDTPAGLIVGDAKIKDERVEHVSLQNVASFTYKTDIIIKTQSFGKIKIDIAYGGNFFALVDTNHLDLTIDLKHIDLFSKLGVEILEKINKTLNISHPDLDITNVDLIKFYQHLPLENKERNVVIFENGQFDRSPCGTGTSAMMAYLHTQGKLKINQEYYSESILGSIFKGEIIRFTQKMGYDMIIPKIEGKAWITGFDHFVLDDNDEFQEGFIA